MGGSPCDVKNMPEEDYTDANSCLEGSPGGSYSMSTTAVECNLEEFVTYIADFSQRLGKVFSRVDRETETVKDTIDVTLRDTLNTHIMDPLNNMANSMQCNFLAPLYADVIDSFCYQGMWGYRRIAASYTALGFLMVLLIPLMYTIYRVGRDKLDLGPRPESMV